jgi:CheY-like chemotaxis protein
LDDLLKSLGYTTLLFETADGFLTSGVEGTVDCIISDIQMPGTTGLQLARLMKPRKVPIILITAFPTPEVAQRAKAAGVQRILVKPFNLGELVDELARLLA